MTQSPQPTAHPQSDAASPGSLVAGFLYPFRAFAVLRRNPRLWRYVLIPLLLNLCLGIVLYIGLLSLGIQWIQSWVVGVPGAEIIYILLQSTLIVLLFIAIGFLLLRFGVVLGAPWYSQLSERLEEIRLGHKPVSEPISAVTITRDVWEALSFEAKKLLLFVCIGIPLLILEFLPPIGTAIGSIGGIALAATILCLDFFDPALSRRHLSFRAKLTVIRRTLPSSASFGLISFGLVSIPLLNLLAIPLCVTAGTLFLCDRTPDTLVPQEQPATTQE